MRLIATGAEWIIAIFVITQLVLPLMFDKPLFPLFKRKPAKILDEIAHVNEDIEVDSLEHKLKELKLQRIQRQQAEDLENAKLSPEVSDKLKGKKEGEENDRPIVF